MNSGLLHIYINRSNVYGSVNYAQRAFFNYVYYKPTKIMLLGADFSTVTEPLATTSSLWNLIQAMSSLRTSLTAANIKINGYETFREDPYDAVRALKSRDARIIIANFYEKQGAHVLCEAYHQNMRGGKYVWILLGWLQGQWWNTTVIARSGNCTSKELIEVLDNHFTTDLVYLNDDNETIPSGKNVKQLVTELEDRLGYPPQTHGYYPFAYDAIYAMAFAMNVTENQLSKNNKSLSQFHYGDITMAKMLKDNMDYVKFRGLTGPVSFKSTGDREGNTKINQIQFEGNVGNKVLVGIYKSSSKEIVMNRQLIRWTDNSTPVAAVRRIIEPTSINLDLFIGACATAALGIVLAIGFLIFNLVYRNHRYIKMSSPNLNNIIILGCIIMYASVCVFGLDNRFIPEHLLVLICSLRMWVPIIGFTLAFGTMFAKTYRIYKIFVGSRSNKKVAVSIPQIITDTQLVILVGILLSIDFILLATWQLIDPPTIQRFNISTYQKSQDETIVSQIWLCHSKHNLYWFIALYTEKGLLLLAGMFLAWETRGVRYAALNDSQYIAMSVYNVVILSGVGVLVVSIMAKSINAAYALMSALLIFGNTVILCLVFVPKFIEFKRKDDPIHGDSRRPSMNPSAMQSISATNMALISKTPST
ncbi:uncharacterized protein TRIADDRAFT_57193 [Trichoplax adhaerens]|uniref:G-protein coupled receptors family 3 profile domain-containing protein n=1 Tax=Trichoplax adhaerens TaxID=10228 RepID=B3S0W5_TRIAD|nr:hypothetical protein TRIADDRAFT_57193 [Trichoplax adhaerens]EDV23718.1 hypothetical protein TRIADDRAFT_57193 [Trichoplax adhaerens]|eukprot:XP_002113244.1 hypothetical protein TRIADDRAFT_57193 [Trichoplax adhaerens]